MNCCFTGHRPKQLPWGNNRNDARHKKMIKILENLIDDLIKEGYTDFYSGMALGFDTFAAELIIKKAKKNPNIHLHAVIPCPNQADLWNESDKKIYNKLLKKCSTKTLISPIYTKSCMLLRNQYMVDNSSAVICLWNGTFSGGTAYTVRYAKKMNRTLYVINPHDLQVTVH